jgi:Peroxiredoxin
MLVIDQTIPGLEVEALMPEGQVERFRLSDLQRQWVVLFFYPNALDVGHSASETLRLLRAFQSGGLTACEWKPGEPLLQAS